MNALAVVVAVLAVVSVAEKQSQASDDKYDNQIQVNKADGNADFSNDVWSIQFTSKATNLQFAFWPTALDQNGESGKSTVKAMTLFEQDPSDAELDGFRVPSSTFSLSSSHVEWEVTDVVVVDDATGACEFSYVGVGKDGDKCPFQSMVLTFHVDGSVADGSMKFDVEIIGYTWTSDSPDAQLVIEWNLKGGNGGDNKQSESGEKVSTGDGEAYMDATDQAEACDGNASCRGSGVDTTPVAAKLTCDAAASADSSFYASSVVDHNDSLYVVYDHFEGSLLHDPTFGIGEVDDSGAAAAPAAAPAVVAALSLLTALLAFVRR